MIFLTGNFLNAVDRDGLHGSLLDPMLLCASDKTRLGLSCSECLQRYSHLIIPLVMWMGLGQHKFMARYWPVKPLPENICTLRTSGVMCVFLSRDSSKLYVRERQMC